MYKIGDTGSVSVTVFPSDATDKSYQLTANNTSRLTVSQNGQFTCNTAGSVNITATATNGVTRTVTINIVNLNTLASEVFRLTNEERVNNGLTALSNNNSALNSAAMTRASESITSFSHTRPDGRPQRTAYEDAGGKYDGYYIGTGENLANGFTSSSSAVQGWMNSEGHKNNILNSHYTHLGVGVAMDSTGRLYWAQLFYG